MTAADVTRLRRELGQRDAMIEQQAVQIDTQALTIERYQRADAAKDRKIEELTGQRDHWQRKAPTKKNQEVAARRQRVREMSLQGMPRKAIAEALNITPRKVKADCTYLQEKGLLPVFSSGTPGMTVEQVEERRAKVKALVAENVTQREIAARLGFGFGAIQNDIRVMRDRGELQ